MTWTTDDMKPTEACGQEISRQSDCHQTGPRKQTMRTELQDRVSISQTSPLLPLRGHIKATRRLRHGVGGGGENVKLREIIDREMVCQDVSSDPDTPECVGVSVPPGRERDVSRAAAEGSLMFQ